MKLIQKILGVAVVTLFFLAGTFTASAQVADTVPTNVVRMSSLEHVNDALQEGILTLDAASKSVSVTNGAPTAQFNFTFTNVSTNELVVLHVTPSCGCTTLEMPPTPWRIAAQSGGTIKATVNLAGKSGTLSKTLHVFTDHGGKILSMTIKIAPPPAVRLTEAQMAAGIAAAKVNRQAVFKGDCAACHLNPTLGKFGPQLYAAACAICHEAKPRASMVPDLHHLADAAGKPLPTNEAFWRAMITSGKEGTLMPAFTLSQGGPLNDLQIASLAAFLNAAIPLHPSPNIEK